MPVPRTPDLHLLRCLRNGVAISSVIPTNYTPIPIKYELRAPTARSALLPRAAPGNSSSLFPIFIDSMLFPRSSTSSKFAKLLGKQSHLDRKVQQNLTVRITGKKRIYLYSRILFFVHRSFLIPYFSFDNNSRYCKGWEFHRTRIISRSDRSFLETDRYVALSVVES